MEPIRSILPRVLSALELRHSDLVAALDERDRLLAVMVEQALTLRQAAGQLNALDNRLDSILDPRERRLLAEARGHVMNVIAALDNAHFPDPSGG